jgi:hypothetical protein
VGSVPSCWYRSRFQNRGSEGQLAQEDPWSKSTSADGSKGNAYFSSSNKAPSEHTGRSLKCTQWPPKPCSPNSPESSDRFLRTTAKNRATLRVDQRRSRPGHRNIAGDDKRHPYAVRIKHTSPISYPSPKHVAKRTEQQKELFLLFAHA